MTPITAPQTPSSRTTGSLATAPRFTTVWQPKQGLWAICRDGRPVIWMEPSQHHLAWRVIKALEAEHDS